VDETGHRAVVPSLSASAPGGASLFTGIMDRVLFTRYLVERFAFASFLQLGCAGSSSSHVYQLLPDTAVPTRVCVDAGASRVFCRIRGTGCCVALKVAHLSLLHPLLCPLSDVFGRPRVCAHPAIRLPQRVRRGAGTKYISSAQPPVNGTQLLTSLPPSLPPARLP
jgi:hypothetical protein